MQIQIPAKIPTSGPKGLHWQVEYKSQFEFKEETVYFAIVGDQLCVVSRKDCAIVAELAEVYNNSIMQAIEAFWRNF